MKLVIDMESVNDKIFNALAFDDEEDKEIMDEIIKELIESGLEKQLEDQIAMGLIQELIKDNDIKVRLKS